MLYSMRSTHTTHMHQQTHQHLHPIGLRHIPSTINAHASRTQQTHTPTGCRSIQASLPSSSTLHMPTVSSIPSDKKMTLGICSATGSPAQTFAPKSVVASAVTPILCGAPCLGAANAMCGYDIAAVDWCGDTGSGFENSKLSATRFCDSDVNQVWFRCAALRL